jgi:hypothetical protein
LTERSAGAAAASRPTGSIHNTRKKDVKKVILVAALTATAIGTGVSTAQAEVRAVRPGGTFHLSNHALIDKVWIENAPSLRLRLRWPGAEQAE